MKTLLRTLAILLAAPLAATAEPTLANSDDIAALESSIGLKVPLSSLSTNGGASKVPQFDANGDLRFSGSAPTGDPLTIGGVFFQDLERLWFLNSSRNDGGSIFYYTAHDVNGGELQVNSPNRMALCVGPYGAIQIGLASSATYNMQFAYLQSRGSATGTITSTNSLPLYFQPTYWTGSAAASTLAGSIQAVADGTTGNSTLDFSTRATQPSGSGADGSRPLDMRISSSGVWEAGKAPAMDVLTPGATITQTCSIYKTVQAAKVTLDQASTLAISGAVAGMRGVIYVKQDTTGSRTLALPVNSAKSASWALSTTPAFVDRLVWEFDGSYYYWTITAGIEIPTDADVTIFADAGRANITDAGQKAALNDFVVALKASDVSGTGTLWSKFSVIYPFIGGTSAAHAKNLKSTSYDITWVNDNAARHTSSGVNGDVASSFYGNTGFNMNLLSQNSAALYAYCKTTSPTGGTYLLGATNGTTSRSLMAIGGGTLTVAANSAGDGSSSSVSADYRKHFAINRNNSANYDVFINATKTNLTSTSAAPWTSNVFLFGRNASGSPSGYTNATLGMVAFGASLTDAEWTAFRSIVDTYQTALGRANP